MIGKSDFRFVFTHIFVLLSRQAVYIMLEKKADYTV